MTEPKAGDRIDKAYKDRVREWCVEQFQKEFDSMIELYSVPTPQPLDPDYLKRLNQLDRAKTARWQAVKNLLQGITGRIEMEFQTTDQEKQEALEMMRKVEQALNQKLQTNVKHDLKKGGVKNHDFNNDVEIGFDSEE